MSFRRIIFWMHLAVGCLGGVVIFVMSATGVVMTYERQIIAAIELRDVAPPDAGVERLSVDALLAPANALTNSAENTQLLIQRRDAAPITVLAGRRVAGLLDPYTGALIENRAENARAFFNWNRSLHRWLALEGTSRETGKAITGAANLGFIFIIVSGLYLWLPKVWRWSAISAKALFQRRYATSKSRDYNWHHVFGVWALAPLFILAVTATVFSYDWASNFVYRAVGDVPGSRSAQAQPPRPLEDPVVSLQSIVDNAASYDDRWKRMRLPIASTSAFVDVQLDWGSGGEPTKRATLSYDLNAGQISSVETFDDIAPGRRARIYIRYLHTGEALGLWGQTLAGLASLAGCFLVYTGLALAYRRLIAPRLKSRVAV